MIVDSIFPVSEEFNLCEWVADIHFTLTRSSWLRNVQHNNLQTK